jgi:hypothetical protein
MCRCLSETPSTTGARSAYKVMGCLLDQGDYEQLHKLIARQAQQVQAIQGLRPKARRH